MNLQGRYIKREDEEIFKKKNLLWMAVNKGSYRRADSRKEFMVNDGQEY